MTELILIALHTLAYRLRGMGAGCARPKGCINPADTDIGELNKPIYWLVCIAILLPYLVWWHAILVGCAILVASRPSYGEQYAKILGNFSQGFDTDWITDKLLPKSLHAKPLLWAHLAMLTRGLWFSLPFILMDSYLSAMLAPVVFYVGYVLGAYVHSWVMRVPLGKSWKGGEYLFGFLYSVLILSNLW